jgi:hypothetical protein
MNIPEPSNFIQEIIVDDLKTGKRNAVHTRFPPEPNGYLHIGHAKSICLNFSTAAKFGGKTNLRFDDTNPSKEEVEYVDSIRDDVHWLGFDWEEREYFASDYYDQIYDFAEQLILKGKAYVCELKGDAVSEYRGTLTEPGKPSPWRERPVSENLDLFRRMKAGEFEEGACFLRAKIDMAHPNMNMRDPAVYRIKKASHHRTGDKWCIYPMYDFAHPISDWIENITHSICTLEFEAHRPLYDWFLQALELENRPQQIEFARLNLSYTMMSKRRLLELVQNKVVMRYGIPEFRLPKSIVDREIQTLEAMGVHFETNYVVGRTRKLMDLLNKDGFDALFIGTGAGLPLFMGIKGESLVGVFAANEYLTRANLMKAYDKDHADTPMWPGKNVVVLGGGNVAMDSARMALRLGAEKVRIVYRRSMAELPARGEEIHHAQEEGVEFCVLQNPSEILGDENGRVRGMIVDKYELGAPDEKGRPRPVKLEGQSFEMECDTVLVAIGNGSNPLISQSTPELKVNKRGNIELEDQEVNKTFVERVYAGGDIVLGAATVILAMGEGRKAAKGINEYLAKN